ncbi:MAG: peptidoglycan editing factor PgeF [Acidaminobacteraceae bacterium]
MENSSKYLELYDFDKSVLAGTTYRLNGKSETPFKSLNLGFNSGDDVLIVLDNYSYLIEELGLKDKFLFLTNQVHGDKIKVIRKEDIASKVKSDIYNPSDMITFVDEHDGMVTNVDEVALMTFYADCVPLVFFDPIKKVIGNCHAGWRGTVKKIPSVVIKHMVDDFGSKPSNIMVAIGPCASSCCYEVDKNVIDEFINSFNNSNGLYTEKPNGKYMLNLKLANKLTLVELGIDEANITISKNCTMCNNDLFFSYRIENGITGRHSAIITIK